MRAQHRNGCVCSVCTAGDVSSGMELGLSFAAALFQGAIMPWAVQAVWAEGTPRGSGTPHKPHPPRCLLLLPPGSTDHGQGARPGTDTHHRHRSACVPGSGTSAAPQLVNKQSHPYQKTSSCF